MLYPNRSGIFGRDAEKRANAREDGIYLEDLKPGEELDLSTAHHEYHLVKQDESHVRISGHPMYCPQPVDVEFEGSFADKWPSMPKPGFIGCGMHLMFKHPEFDLVATSEIREIHRVH